MFPRFLSSAFSVLVLFSLYASADLVPTSPLILPYHGGPLLTGGRAIKVYLTWYGRFSPSQKAIVTDFLRSFTHSSHPNDNHNGNDPTVRRWWEVMASYTDAHGKAVMGAVRLGGQISDRKASLGKLLKSSDIKKLVERSLRIFPSDPKAMYLVLTAADIAVEGFCSSVCASHAYTFSSPSLAFAWVGNSATQCPGQCAWPFAVPDFLPSTATALVSPNGDVGIDGMIINIAAMLAGAAVNPYGNGYFQGDASAPLEAATACSGIFGTGSYPGYPGSLLESKMDGSQFNAYGVKSRKFLLPALWNPSTLACNALP